LPRQGGGLRLKAVPCGSPSSALPRRVNPQQLGVLFLVKL
jgi:hypothetical protein